MHAIVHELARSCEKEKDVPVKKKKKKIVHELARSREKRKR
jgi:hypothetical protein